MSKELDQGRVEGGDRLIAALRQDGVTLNAAFWIFNSILDEWRLILVSPHVETRGPRQLLRQAGRALDHLDGKTSFDLFDVDFESPYSLSLGQLLTKIPRMQGARTFLGDVTIDKNLAPVSLFSYFMEYDRILRLNGASEHIRADQGGDDA